MTVNRQRPRVFGIRVDDRPKSKDTCRISVADIRLALELYGPEGIGTPEEIIASRCLKCEPGLIGSR